MRQKNLVDRLELAVQQEIKNYKDTVLSQNLAMNDLRSQITKVSDRIENRCSFLESKITSLERLLSNFELSENKFREDAKRAFSDNKILLEKVSLENSILSKESAKAALKLNELEEKVQFLADSQYNSIKENKKAEQSMYSEVSNLREFLMDRICCLKDEILSVPSVAEPIKEELFKELAIHQVNFKGVLRELQASKKSVHILQKNMENIYNLIERSK